jgi:hypothetical protein
MRLSGIPAPALFCVKQRPREVQESALLPASQHHLGGSMVKFSGFNHVLLVYHLSG